MRHKVIGVQVKALGDRQVETIASTATLDREQDRILASAWRLDRYRLNPVVLWAHDYRQPPVAKSLDVRVVGDRLRTLDLFPPKGAYPFADTVYELLTGGFLSAKSVGFTPLQSRPNDEGGRDYTEVELLETSFVPVPANPEALVVARTKGIRDRAALDRFFGAPRGSDLVLPAGVGPADIVVALQSGLDTAVRREVRHAARRLGLLPAAEESGLVIEDPRYKPVAGGATVVLVEPQEIGEALGGVVGRIVVREVRGAINALRGRVD
ncbi:MAG: HK97 family phage prohead protease [Elusimicrobia bacterium]|nr:HK97 family phage prohead protease [Elusimicrobiota bacterium]